jgi:hypothetical protein
VKPLFTAQLYDHLNEDVPRQFQHYALTQVVDYAQVVLAELWTPTRIYWDFMNKAQPLYVQMSRVKTAMEACGMIVPAHFKLPKPILSLTRALKEINTFNIRFGKVHSDICPICYKHDMHIALSKEVNALQETKDLAAQHVIDKKAHLLRANRATLQQTAEREECLRWNEQEAKDGVKNATDAHCSCGNGGVPGRCRCHWKTREGFAHFQMDKGSKLGLPQTMIGPLWYKSRSAMFVEHITDTSRAGTGRRTAHMWEESVAAGGKDNMISVLYHYLRHHCTGRKGLCIWVDNCFHEFKNWSFVFFIVWLVTVEKMFEWVEVKYYETGHSAMGGYGPDSTHASVIKAGRKVLRKMVPDDWIEAARRAGCAAGGGGGIEVVEFGLQHHRNWDRFTGQYYVVDSGKGGERTKKDIDGQRVDLTKFRKIVVRAEDRGLVTAFLDLGGSPGVRINVLKRRFPTDTIGNPLHPRFDLPPNPLSYNQVKGILSTWSYMKEGVERDYWYGRLVNQRTIVAGQLSKSRSDSEFKELLRRVLDNETDTDSEEDKQWLGPARVRSKKTKEKRAAKKKINQQARKVAKSRNRR